MLLRVLVPPIATLLLLAACQSEPPVASAPGETGTCGAAAHQGLIGREGTVLDTMRFAEAPRIIRPGTMMTMDYRAERLNIGINEAGKIERVYCG